jgi:uncharacterized membrane protein YqjE
MSAPHTDPADPAPEPASAVRGLAAALLDYFDARASLFRLESRESGRRLGLAVALVAGAVAGALFAYALALAATVAWISAAAGWPWYAVGLAAALLHAVAALAAARAARTRFRARPFEATLSELRKDRQWIHERLSEKKPS